MRSRAPPALKVSAYLVLLFLNFPAAVIFLYAFSAGTTYSFPPPGLTTRWFAATVEREDMWQALRLSLEVATVATLVSLVLGTMLAGALFRARFVGKGTLTVLITLPIALPGILTGIALLSAMRIAGVEPGFWTIVAGHVTFCVVIVHNNVVARLRRMPASLFEASLDLGADLFQTFRHVVMPQLATALLAGGLLAFALSFDEIIVTLFTAGTEKTLPIWFYGELFRPREGPVTNVVALMVVTFTAVPVLLAYRLTRGTEEVSGSSR